MSVLTKTHRTNFSPKSNYLRISSGIPRQILADLKRRYAKYLEADSELYDYFETGLANKIAKDLTVGKRVSNLREVMGLSQMALGAKAELSAAKISDIENDRRKVGLVVAKRLAMALGVDVRLVLGPDL
jgi:DNA-binding XRE family transcriptional regulator